MSDVIDDDDDYDVPEPDWYYVMQNIPWPYSPCIQVTVETIEIPDGYCSDHTCTPYVPKQRIEYVPLKAPNGKSWNWLSPAFMVHHDCRHCRWWRRVRFVSMKRVDPTSAVTVAHKQMAFLDDFPVDIPIDEHLLSLESTMRNAWNFRSRSENVHAAFSERAGRSGTASRRVGPDAMDDLEANAQVMFETLSGELGAGGPSGPNSGQLVPTAANNRVWGAERPAEEGIVEPKAALGTSAIGTTTTWIFVGAVAVVVIMMYTFSAGGKRKALRK